MIRQTYLPKATNLSSNCSTYAKLRLNSHLGQVMGQQRGQELRRITPSVNLPSSRTTTAQRPGCASSLRLNLRSRCECRTQSDTLHVLAPYCTVLTTVYNCAQIKLTTPRYGGSLWEMLLSIPTGDGHDQEQDSEYHTRISKPGKVHSRHRDHIGHSQEHSAQIPAPPGTGRHAPSTSQSSFQARSV